MFKFLILLFFLIFGNMEAETKNGIVDDEIYRKVLDEKMEKLWVEKKFSDIQNLYKQLDRKDFKFIPANVADKTAKNLPELYQQVIPSSVIVVRGHKSALTKKWQTSLAGGVVIHQDGIIVTNYHVLEPSLGDFMAVMFDDKEVFPILEILAADKKNDLAVIRVGREKLTPVKFAQKSETAEKIFTVSHPDGQLYSFSEGVITRIYFTTEQEEKVQRLSISADFAKGSSGSGVFNSRGELVAIISSTKNIYHKNDQEQKEHLQMVLKVCIPVEKLFPLLKMAE